MDKKGKKALTNYLYNNKFPIFLRSQPLDNLFIKSLLPKLKRERAVLLSLPPTKKIKIKNQKIIIDNIFILNYIIKNDSKINQYVNYLIDKGIIIQQRNSSENFLFKKVNEFTGNMIEKIEVTVGKNKIKVTKGTTLEELAPNYQDDFKQSNHK